MILAIFITILIGTVITFLIGFLFGYNKGEASVNVRLKYALLREDNARYKLAIRGLKDRLKAKNGDPITEPEYDPDYDYEEIEV
ncbi:hypothetical protein ccbrp13_56050 [Ktedonobacteria bacterium brp13]|nr:hypothetical protein ccbrp13_56050 [Ktedonobacteria bacterium brp13]